MRLRAGGLIPDEAAIGTRKRPHPTARTIRGDSGLWPDASLTGHPPPRVSGRDSPHEPAVCGRFTRVRVSRREGSERDACCVEFDPALVSADGSGTHARQGCHHETGRTGRWFRRTSGTPNPPREGRTSFTRRPPSATRRRASRRRSACTSSYAPATPRSTTARTTASTTGGRTSGRATGRRIRATPAAAPTGRASIAG